MKRCLIPFIAVSAIFLCVSGAFALDIPLTFVEHSAKPQSGEYIPIGHQFFEGSIEPPDGRWKLPLLDSMQPIFATFTLGDTKILMVFDIQNFDDAVYNRIYIDSNLNEDLTDDPPIDGNVRNNPRNKNACEVRFDPITTTIKVNGSAVPYCFLLNFSVENIRAISQNKLTTQSAAQFVRMYIRTYCTYESECDINGQRCRFLLEDNNCNGRFNDNFSIRERTSNLQRIPLYTQGDRIIINGDDPFASNDSQPLCDRLFIGGTLYDMEVNIPEKKIILTETKGELVPLNLSMDVEQLTIHSKDLAHGLNMFRPGKKSHGSRGYL